MQWLLVLSVTAHHVRGRAPGHFAGVRVGQSRQLGAVTTGLWRGTGSRATCLSEWY